MATRYLRYVSDSFKTREFEHYAKLWIPLVEKFGGDHHGHFMPHEGASDMALVLFAFQSLADYGPYRVETKCFPRVERTFMGPVFK